MALEKTPDKNVRASNRWQPKIYQINDVNPTVINAEKLCFFKKIEKLLY